MIGFTRVTIVRRVDYKNYFIAEKGFKANVPDKPVSSCSAYPICCSVVFHSGLKICWVPVDHVHSSSNYIPTQLILSFWTHQCSHLQFKNPQGSEHSDFFDTETMPPKRISLFTYALTLIKVPPAPLFCHLTWCCWGMMSMQPSSTQSQATLPLAWAHRFLW